MAALTPAERQKAIALYKQWIPPTGADGEAEQLHPFWETTSPIQVVTAAFNSIFGQLSDVRARAEYREELADESHEILNQYDDPRAIEITVPLGDGDLLVFGAPQADQDKLDRAIFEILRAGFSDLDADHPPNGPVIDVNRADLLPQEPILYTDYEEGQHIIQIQGNPNWVFDAESLWSYWKPRGRKTNPLVSGFNGPALPDDQIKYGTLHIIEPKGGRRRKTKKSKRRARKTRRYV
jgi:hypothetical protein